MRAIWAVVALTVAWLAANQSAVAQGDKIKLIHDSEYSVLEAQHGERWAAEDNDLNRNLAELRKKHGAPPNIIHIMWDDTAVGEVGIPALQGQRALWANRIK
jgi:arylsulfatase